MGDGAGENFETKHLQENLTRLSTRFDKNTGEIFTKLNKIHTDVEVIKTTCEQRSETCAKRVINLDKTIRGNSGSGLLTRVKTLENQSSTKEKFVWLIVGVLGTGLVSLLIALVVNLIKS